MKNTFNLKSLVSIKGHLINSSQPIRDIKNVRKKVDTVLYEDIIKFVCSVSKLNKPLFGNAYPKTIERLRLRSPLEPLNLEREIIWSSSYIKFHHDSINKFITLSSLFNSSLLNGDFDECEKCLNDIEHNFGLSFWLIKNKIAFLQISKGLEAHKNYSTSLRLKISSQSPTFFLSTILVIAMSRLYPILHIKII